MRNMDFFFVIKASTNDKNNNNGREVLDQLWYPIYWMNIDDFSQRKRCCINQPIAIPDRLAFWKKKKYQYWKGYSGQTERISFGMC